MHDDPRDIAAYMVQQHGLDGALSAAIEGAIGAQHDGDNYSLSVWREIKAVIRAQLAAREAGHTSGDTALRDAG